MDRELRVLEQDWWTPWDKNTHKPLWSPQCFIHLCTLSFLFFSPAETWLSSSQTGLDRLSRAQDAALCRSWPAASSHYHIHLFEDFSLKADKSSCHEHFSQGRISSCTQKIKGVFEFVWLRRLQTGLSAKRLVLTSKWLFAYRLPHF